MSPRKPRPTEPTAPPEPPPPAVEPVGSVEPAVQAVDPGPPPPPRRVFLVSRRRSGDREPHFDDFEIEIGPDDTVLDALLRIRRTREPTLVVRHSCMHASCGTCGVRINGREALACDTKVEAISPEPPKPIDPAAPIKPIKPIKVEPLAGQRPVADLATDMVDFYARFDAAGMPQVRGAGVPLDLGPLESIQSFSRFEDCIECGLCLSACPEARIGHDFIGPAALAAAARVVAEPRGAELGPVLALAAEPDSVWRCHSAMECTAVCPSAVEPALALFTLRRHIAANGARRFFGRGV
jgi:succinate dehydrogenase / fumarate reductase iron-sulfur subunit